MSLPESTTVLIVGAGPVGLTAAISLFHHGVRDITIVDALHVGQNSSRAIAMHAATLEALDTLGCGDDVVSQGTKASAVSVGTRSTKLAITSTESLKAYTRHPYLLVITQNVTERILEKKLESFGVVVHRPLRVVGLRRNASNPQLTDVTFEDGRVTTAKYVIGADGARSVVRTMAGISFSDPTAEGEAENTLSQMVLGDVIFDVMDVDHAALGRTMSPDNFFICLALPHTFNESLAAEGMVTTFAKIYRIGCGVPLERGEIPHAPSKEYLQNLIDEYGPYCLSSDPAVNPNPQPTRIKDLIWSSRFRNHAAIASTPFVRLGGGDDPEQGGVILLVGDAAHIHSPAGGQGMNLGMRDAVFLGEALTKHIRATETEPLSQADTILRAFADMRHARALEVIQLTKRMVSVEGMKHRVRMAWWFPIDSATIRACVMWVLGCIPFVQRRMAWELSGLGRR